MLRSKENSEMMQSKLHSMYADLRGQHMDQHARDFWRTRAGKQQQQVRQDKLLHEYTAVTQYMLWHNNRGVRLPSFLRGTSACLAGPQS
jgi:hypothetical protein